MLSLQADFPRASMQHNFGTKNEKRRSKKEQKWAYFTRLELKWYTGSINNNQNQTNIRKTNKRKLTLC